MLHELAGATGKRIVFYCAFGERSAMAVQAAQDAGIAIGLPHPRRHRRLAQGQRTAGALVPNDPLTRVLHQPAALAIVVFAGGTI